jgi:outer membrane protein assembly factor BamB
LLKYIYNKKSKVLKMKKILTISLLLLLSILNINVLGISNFLKNTCELNIMPHRDWIAAPSKKSNQIIYQHKERIASINIKAYVFASEVPTANGLQIRRRNSYYDGWINMFERIGSEAETEKANVDESYIAVYSKHILGSNLGVKKQIKGEYYYIKENKAYIITISTTTNYWRQIQASMKSIIDSFWIGAGDRPIVKAKKKTNIWGMPGKNSANQNYIKANPDLSKILEKEWEYNLNENEEIAGITLPVVDKKSIYFSLNETILSINKKTGTANWAYKLEEKIEKNLILNEDIIYLIGNSNPSYLYAIMAQNGSLLYKAALGVSVDQISHPIIAEDKIVLIINDNLIAIEKNTGEKIWQQERRFDNKKYPVASGNIVVSITKDNKLIACNLADGKIIWEKYSDNEIGFSPTIAADKLIVSYNTYDWSRSGSQLRAYDLETGESLWWADNKYNDWIISKAPSVGPLGIYVAYFSDTEVSQDIVAYSVDKGSMLWKQGLGVDAGLLISRPIVASQLLITSGHIGLVNTLVGLDVLAGGKIEMPLVNMSKYSADSKVSSIRLYDDQVIAVIKGKKGVSLTIQK